MMLARATTEHIKHVCNHLRDDDRLEVMALRWDESDIAETLITAQCEKFAIVHEGKACCIMGVINIWPNVGQAFLIGTDEIGKYGVEVAHVAKRIISAFLSTGIHRIHAYSSGNHFQAHHWLETIGFKREALLHKYGKSGEDFIVYSIVAD